MDPNRSFERKYNRNGWPFMILADENGNIIYQCTNLADNDKTLMGHLKELGKTEREFPEQTINGVSYLKTTVGNSGMAKKKVSERFASIACGKGGKVYTTYTSIEDDNSNVYLRIQDDKGEVETVAIADTEANEYDSNVIVDKSGMAWVCWTSNAEKDIYNIYMISLENAKKGVEPVAISQGKEDCMHGRMALDNSGDIWITYYKWQKMKNISRDKEVYVRKYDIDGELSKEVVVSPQDVPAYEDHTDPEIAFCNGKSVICWSWDFHKPKGYTKKAHSPTIFAAVKSVKGKTENIFNVSTTKIDMTPDIAACGNELWCVWDALGRGSKAVFARRFNDQDTIGDIIHLSNDCVNVCSPTVSFYGNSKGAIVWSQTSNGQDWALYRADYNSGDKTWGEPTKITDEANPRFSSCCYDTKGKLWLAYSVVTDEGHEVNVKQY